MARGHTNEAQDAILTAAEKCFAEAGFAGTSVNDILAGTRFTKPVLYYHFGSKEGLFRALLERAQAACFDVIRQRAADAPDLEGQLTGIITALFELLRDRRDLTRLLIATAFAAPRELPETLRAEARRMRTFVFVRGLIAAARRRGELDSRHSAHALACNFLRRTDLSDHVRCPRLPGDPTQPPRCRPHRHPFPQRSPKPMTARIQPPSRHRFQACLLVATALALGACKPSQPAVPPKPPTPPVAVRVTPATERPIPRFIRVTGQLLGYQDALVAADIGGKVSETRVERGSKVSKGDVLVQIDNRGPTLSLQEAEASLALAQARLALARSDVERNAPLVQTRAVAEADFRRFEADLAIREAELAGARSRRDQARKSLDDCTTRAPFTGVVVERFVQPGEYVRADSRIVRLVELARLRLVLNVPEPLSGGIQPGQAVDFQTAAFPGQTFSGEVRFVSSAVREATRDLQIEAEVSNTDERLRPGFFAEARIRTGDQKATTIPASALRTEGNRRSVFLVEGDTLVERLVEVGDVLEGWVEIRRGLTNGTPVVNPAEPRLADGLPAQVTQP